MTITSVEQLKQLAQSDNGIDVAIILQGGLRSSKTIYYFDNKFLVCNDIDGSEQRLTEKQLFTHSNIGEAIKQKALINYE
jgi:hypothetical protein